MQLAKMPAASTVSEDKMRNKLEVNLGKIKYNLQVVRDVLPKACKVIAVVKANAYGHGGKEVSSYLQEACGIDYFAVAGLDEALKRRKAGIKGDILVLSYVDPAELNDAIENNITLAVVSAEHAIALSCEAHNLGKTANVHIKLNTGMNRVGFDCKTFKQIMTIAGAYKLPNLNFTGIFSHFSSSDDSSSGAEPYTKLQLERFNKVLSYLSERGINPGLRHISNSGAIGKYPQARFDAVRCGALMYGYNTAMDAKLPVVPVMEWKALISCIRTIDFGDAVSYSRKFVAKQPTKIATLSVGYADGLSRALSNKGSVIINGQKCPMIGNICMDQMMVDITNLKEEVRVGDLATIIGAGQTADDLAAIAGSCMHEVISSIASRVERFYIQ